MFQYLNKWYINSRPCRHPQLLSFDHVYPDVETPAPVLILYGSISSPNFRELHDYVYALTKEPQPKARYVFRHAPVSRSDPLQHYLSGYGVFMDLKKMDYLALDDRQQSRNDDGNLLYGQGISSSHVSVGVVVSNGETESEETTDIDYISTLVNRTEDVDLSRALTQEEIAGKYWFGI